MHSTTKKFPAATQSRHLALANLVVGALARLRQRLENHRAARRLAALDDHMLADIGLSRSEIEAAVIGDWRLYRATGSGRRS